MKRWLIRWWLAADYHRGERMRVRSDRQFAAVLALFGLIIFIMSFVGGAIFGGTPL